MRMKKESFLFPIIFIVLLAIHYGIEPLARAQSNPSVSAPSIEDSEEVPAKEESPRPKEDGAGAAKTEAGGPEKCLNCQEALPLETNKNLLDLAETTARMKDPCLQLGSPEERAKMNEKWLKEHPDEKTRTIDSCISTGIGDTIIHFGDSISAIGNMIRDPEERAAAMSAIGDFMSLMGSHPLDTGKAYLAAYAQEKQDVFQAIQKCLSGEEAVRATCSLFYTSAVDIAMALNAVKSVVGLGVKKVLTAKAAKGLKKKAAEMEQLSVGIDHLRDDRSVVQLAERWAQEKIKTTSLEKVKVLVGMNSNQSNLELLERLKDLSRDLEKTKFSDGALKSVNINRQNFQILNSRVMGALIDGNPLLKEAFVGPNKAALLKRITSGRAGSAEVNRFEQVVRQYLNSTLKEKEILPTDTLNDVMAKVDAKEPGEIGPRLKKLGQEIEIGRKENQELVKYYDRLEDGYSYGKMVLAKFNKIRRENRQVINKKYLKDRDKNGEQIKAEQKMAEQELREQPVGRLAWANGSGGNVADSPITQKLNKMQLEVDDLAQIEKSLDQALTRQENQSRLKFWDRRKKVSDLESLQYLAGVTKSTENVSEILMGLRKVRQNFSEFPRGKEAHAQFYWKNQSYFTRIEKKLSEVQSALEKNLEDQLKERSNSKKKGGLLSLKKLSRRGDSTATRYLRAREIPREIGLVDEAGNATSLDTPEEIARVLERFRNFYPTLFEPSIKASKKEINEAMVKDLQKVYNAFDPNLNLEADEIYNGVVQKQLEKISNRLPKEEPQ